MEDSFGTRLRQIREKLKLTQTDLAKKLGIAQITLSNYETDKRNPDTVFLLRLKAITGVNIDFLLTGEGEERISSQGKQIVKLLSDPMARYLLFGVLEELKVKYPDIFGGLS